MNKETYEATERELDEAIQVYDMVGNKQAVSRLTVAVRRHNQAKKWKDKEEIRRGYAMAYWTEEGRK